MVTVRCSCALGHLDGGLLVDAEQRDVGHADEGPFLIGPEHDDGSSLRGLGGNVEVGKANASQVGGQTDKNVPVGVESLKSDWLHFHRKCNITRSDYYGFLVM